MNIIHTGTMSIIVVCTVYVVLSIFEFIVIYCEF